ncbi:MAG TPA: hypothetical protein VF194_17125 [Ferrovibrio sp.]|uniref:hypothetical protein n=1 Tax=Ferrovibrio sp. TaxID=1917215 RepID=UPI002ED021FE
MRASNPGLLLLLTLALLWAVGGYVFYRLDRWHDERDYRLLADLAAYKGELAKSTPSPRIVIAGGSNAYYGIDARQLERRLGVPTVNVALPFGAHHYRINLDLLSELVRAGDTIVYASANFWQGEIGVRRRAIGFDSYLVKIDYPDYDRQFKGDILHWQALPHRNSLLLSIVDVLKAEKGRSWIVDTDDHGDFTGCVPPPVLSPQRFEGDLPNAKLAKALLDAAARLRQKGVQLLVHMPWLFISEHDRERWMHFRDQFIRQYEPAIPVLAAEPSRILRSKRSDFCDSPLHPSREATKLRTEDLVTALKPYLRDRVAASANGAL